MNETPEQREAREWWAGFTDWWANFWRSVLLFAVLAVAVYLLCRGCER